MTQKRLTGSNPSRRAQRKAALIDLLREKDAGKLLEWSRHAPDPLSALATILFENEPLLRWRAIEAIGLVAADMSVADRDKVRLFLRRLLWLMNDESGGICWYAPEAIAEVLHQVPSLVDEFAPLLLSFLREEPFESGVCRGMARLLDGDAADAVSKLAADQMPVLLSFLESPNAELRGSALYAIRKSNIDISDDLAVRLARDAAQILIYDFENGVMRAVSIARLLVGRPI